MLSRLLNNATIDFFRSALDGLARRQEAISNNIANIDTPGYQRQDVSFEDALRARLGETQTLPLATTAERHIQPTGAFASRLGQGQGTDAVLSTRNDANNVDIDQEMSNLAETQIRYQTLSQALSNKLQTLRDIIQQSR